jgi:hypothetical protein
MGGGRGGPQGAQLGICEWIVGMPRRQQQLTKDSHVILSLWPFLLCAIITFFQVSTLSKSLLNTDCDPSGGGEMKEIGCYGQGKRGRRERMGKPECWNCFVCVCV